jgi:hypothetical protein
MFDIVRLASVNRGPGRGPDHRHVIGMDETKKTPPMCRRTHQPLPRRCGKSQVTNLAFADSFVRVRFHGFLSFHSEMAACSVRIANAKPDDLISEARSGLAAIRRVPLARPHELAPIAPAAPFTGPLCQATRTLASPAAPDPSDTAGTQALSQIRVIRKVRRPSSGLVKMTYAAPRLPTRAARWPVGRDCARSCP